MAKRKADDGHETRTVRGIGDNSGDKPIEGKKLLGFIEELEKIQKQIDVKLQDKREVYADAKAVGFDNKIIRKVLNERKMEPEKRKEQADLLDAYRAALGMLDDDE